MKRRAQRHTRGPYLGLRSCGGLEPIPAFMSREAGARSPVYLKANKKRQTPIQFHSHTCGHFSHQLIQHGSLWIVGGKQTTWRLSSMHRKHMQTPGKRRYSTRYLIFPLLFTKWRRVETMNRLLDLIFLEMISFTFCIIKWNKFIRFGKSVEKRVGDVTKASAKRMTGNRREDFLSWKPHIYIKRTSNQEFTSLLLLLLHRKDQPTLKMFSRNPAVKILWK